MTVVEKLVKDWRTRLQTECADQNRKTQESTIDWLLGEDRDRYETMSAEQLEIAVQAMDYRYRILQQRYLGVPPEAAYNRLMQRLSSLFLIRNKIRTWVALSRDRQRSVVDVLQEVIQELLQNDRYLQQQIAWIAKCTPSNRLRNTLILATTEEYCLRPIRNQPLLLYRFVNYLRRIQRGGMTQVPMGDLVRVVSEELTMDETDNPISLLDAQAITQYQESEAWEERERQRKTVQKEFAAYLEEKLGSPAAKWLELYLQGRSQEAIAQELNMPVKQVYRLREKISYHAIRIFALKNQPELVASWLETSLKENSLGLTPAEWKQYWENLTATQRQILEQMKAGKSISEIASLLNWKASQVMSEWSKIYLAAQTMRNSD